MYNFFIHSSVDGYLGCFYVLAIVNSVSVNNGIHASFSILVYSVCMPKNGIAGSSVHFSQFSCSVVSDSLQPHGLQPTRLLCPWEFPGKSAGGMPQAINAGEGVEKGEHFCTVGGNANWYSHYGRWYGNSLKNLGIKPPYDPAIPLLDIYPEETKIEKDVSCCSLQYYLQ